MRYMPSPPSVISCERAAVMSTPGAEMSGFMPPEPASGPVLENQARLSCLSVAATVSADAAAPGVEMVSGPALPAAMTNRVPYCAERASTVWDIGSLPSDGTVSPRLMLTTSAPDSAAHCMPAMTQESWPKPSAPPSTFPAIRSAPGATPLKSPPEAAPVPTIVLATWVPCPLTSVIASPGTKLAVPSIWPCRSGWLTSMPVSSTATFTPLPS